MRWRHAAPPPPPAPPPSAPTAAIYQIQGSGPTSPYAGQTVTTSGVVTKVNNNGFFLQDPIGDGNPATSDGIFVFTNTAPTVSAGQAVTLTGKVTEFNVGTATNADTAAHTVTELGSITNLSVTGTGSVAPLVLSFPFATQDTMERYEGMLVTLVGPFTAQQNYFLGRFGEMTLGTGGRLWTPTNVYRPSTDPASQGQMLNADNIRRSIVLDDGSTVQNPNPTPYILSDSSPLAGTSVNMVLAGDTVASITGVIDYGLTTSSTADPGAYKIHPTQPVRFTRVSQPGVVDGDDVGAANIRVGSANIENFFTTLNDGTNKCPPSNTADDCRGANSASELSRQTNKVVRELAGMNADAIALMELQNNGNTTIQYLVDSLNAYLGATTYARVPFAATGGGTDAIQVGMIYRPSRLSLVGAALSDTAAINNRAPMAQTFMAANGEKFTLIGNHLKSKDCGDSTPGVGDADAGDGQGCFNARRVQQADELRAFAARVQSTSGVADTLMVGDFNAYAKEDPVYDLTSNGFVDQIGRYLDKPGSNSYGYSYVFNGTSGRLDQAVTSSSLSPKVTGVSEWHINADSPLVIDYNLEFKQPACPTCNPDYYLNTVNTPYRASDHDPIVIGLNLVHAINGTSANDTIVGTAGDDVITGGVGADRLTGNGGRDVFVYTSMRDAADTITDFTPNDDRLDLSALLASIGANASTAVANGVVQWQQSGTSTVVLIDTDGKSRPGRAAPAGHAAQRRRQHHRPGARLRTRHARRRRLGGQGLGQGRGCPQRRHPQRRQDQVSSNMKQISFAALSAVALALAASSANAAIANGNFAGLTGWSTAGDAASVATGGTHLVLTDAYADGSDDTDGIDRNLSGQNPWATGGGAGSLEQFVSVAGGAFDPDPAGFVQAIEGSAALQTFTAAGGSQVVVPVGSRHDADRRRPDAGRCRLRRDRRQGDHAGQHAGGHQHPGWRRLRDGNGLGRLVDHAGGLRRSHDRVRRRGRRLGEQHVGAVRDWREREQRAGVVVASAVRRGPGASRDVAASSAQRRLIALASTRSRGHELRLFFIAGAGNCPIRPRVIRCSEGRSLGLSSCAKSQDPPPPGPHPGRPAARGRRDPVRLS